MDGSERLTNGDIRAYRAVEGLGAKAEELMAMSLDSVRLSLLRAEVAIAAGDRVEKALALAAASRVVEFLLGLSGVERGGLSERLATAYHYVLAAILRGNIADDTVAVASGRAVIEHLASTWRDLFFAEVKDRAV